MDPLAHNWLRWKPFIVRLSPPLLRHRKYIESFTVLIKAIFLSSLPWNETGLTGYFLFFENKHRLLRLKQYKRKYSKYHLKVAEIMWLKKSTFASSLRKILSRLCMSDFFLFKDRINSLEERFDSTLALW